MDLIKKIISQEKPICLTIKKEKKIKLQINNNDWVYSTGQLIGRIQGGMIKLSS